MNAPRLAQLFHETYERLAPDFGYKTREASAKPWSDVPQQNKDLMIAVAGEILRSDMFPRWVSVEEGLPDTERMGSRHYCLRNGRWPRECQLMNNGTWESAPGVPEAVTHYLSNVPPIPEERG